MNISVKSYLSHFDKHRDSLSHHLPWLTEKRESAARSLAETGFPNASQEDWQFSNPATFLKTSFTLPDYKDQPLNNNHFIHSVPYSYRIQFLNGFCVSIETGKTEQPNGPIVQNLKETLKTSPDIVQLYLGKSASQGNGFTALNTALFEEGAWIHIPKNVQLEHPIQILFHTDTSLPIVTFPRTLIVLEDFAQTSIIEGYFGNSTVPYWTNAVTEWNLGENAKGHHLRFQEESLSAAHIGTVKTRQRSNSQWISNEYTLGAQFCRNAIETALLGEGSETHLNGLYIAGNKQQVDHHTLIDHNKPHCSSQECYKGILDGQSRAVFNGKVVVHKDAQKTQAAQSNKNLLLSKEGWVHTKPDLEIYADDVKCAHGATVGQIQEEALFYLRSRGLTQLQARQLLMHAFAHEMVEKIENKTLRETFTHHLGKRLVQK